MCPSVPYAMFYGHLRYPQISLRWPLFLLSSCNSFYHIFRLFCSWNFGRESDRRYLMREYLGLCCTLYPRYSTCTASKLQEWLYLSQVCDCAAQTFYDLRHFVFKQEKAQWCGNFLNWRSFSNISPFQLLPPTKKEKFVITRWSNEVVQRCIVLGMENTTVHELCAHVFFPDLDVELRWRPSSD